jgi:hypothetical protein
MEITRLFTEVPWWAWALLALIIVRGVKATRPRTVYLPTLFMIPTLMLAIKLPALSGIGFYAQGLYAIAALIGLVIGFLVANKEKTEVFKQDFSIKIPGSYQILVLLLSFFCMKFYYGFLKKTNPEQALLFVNYDLLISGFVTGFLLGKLFSYTNKVCR